MKIIETDNFGGDHPDEKVLNLPPLSEEAAKAIVEVVNRYCSGHDKPRFWRAVQEDYKPAPGFEP